MRNALCREEWKGGEAEVDLEGPGATTSKSGLVWVLGPPPNKLRIVCSGTPW